MLASRRMIHRVCCFSKPVPFLGKTKIFARRDGERELLAYSMNIEVGEDLAMVLPIPVPPSPAEDAVAFLDLRGYGDFFTALEAAFPPDDSFEPLATGGCFAGAPAPRLVVHDVGDFEASFVPTRGDFHRLDERFRMPAGFWDSAPTYADWGFAVFRLKPSRKKQTVHPMAFSFPMREERSVFFPTVHAHGGGVEPEASFEHALYTQVDGLLEATIPWPASQGRLGAFVDGARTRGIVDGERGGFRTNLWGSMANADLWLREPRGVTVEDLRGAGECYAFVVDASHLHAFGAAQGHIARWRDTARERLPALCKGLATGLRAALEARREAWSLAPLTDAMPAHFMNGKQLWTGTSHMNGTRVSKHGGSGRVAFSPSTDHVALTSVTLGFSELPTEARAAEIHAELSALLDRAAGYP